MMSLRFSFIAALIGTLVFAGSLIAPFSTAHAQAPAASTGQLSAAPSSGSGSSGGLDWGTMTIGAILSPIALIAYVVFAIAKAILWVGGIVLNFGVYYLVFEFSKHLGTSPGMLLGWSVLRDLGNIMLLFGFVAIGIQTILNIGHHFSAAKAIPRLVLFAVLLNFSLFVAAAVVDLSNGFTLALFSQNVGYSCDGSLERCINEGVAVQIIQQVDLLSVMGTTGENPDLAAQLSAYAEQPVQSILQWLLLAVLVSAAAAVLLAGGLLIIARGVTLAFLMVTSPIGFAGMAIPSLNKMANEWWDTLIKNALFAPVFLVLLFIGLRMTDGLATQLDVKGGLAGAVTSGGTFDAGPIFMFVLVVGFMIAALTVGKRFSIVGAEIAINAATKTASIPFLYPRDVLGRKAEKWTERYEGSAAARRLRSIPIVGRGIDDAIAGTLKSGTKVSVPGWSTYADDQKTNKARKDHLKHAEHEAHTAHEFDGAVQAFSTDKDKMKKFLQETSLTDLKKLDAFSKGGTGLAQAAELMGADKFKQLMADHDIPEDVRDAASTARKNAVQAKVTDALTAARGGNYDKIEALMRDTNAYDLNTTTQASAGGPELKVMAKSMSVEKFNEFMKNTDVPSNVRSSFKTARYEDFSGTLTSAAGGNVAARKEVQDRFAADIEASGFLNDPAKRRELMLSVSDKQYEQLRNNKSIGSTTRKEMEEIRFGSGPGSRFSDTATAEATLDLFATKKDVTKVPADTLAQRHVLDAMTPAHFYEIANAGRLTDAEKAPLLAYVQGKSTSANMDWAMYAATAGPKQIKKLNDYFGTNL